MFDLFRRYRDAHGSCAELSRSAQKGAITAANVQDSAARPAPHLVKQVIMLIRLRLFERNIRPAAVHSFDQIKDAARREESVHDRVASSNSSRPPAGGLGFNGRHRAPRSHNPAAIAAPHQW